MVAQYQFEQWNYSQKAAAEGTSVQNFAAADAAGTAALDQELQAKENELNNRLKQRYDSLVQEKKKTTPVISQADTLKIVNLQLKLKTLSLSKEERAATEEQLQTLLKGSQADVQVTNRTADEIAALMAPDKAQAKKELDDYAQQVKKDLEGRKADSQQVFQQQLGVLQDRPEPAVWNKEWKDKLDAKEKEMEEYNNLIAAGKKSKDNIDDEISNQKQVIQEMESIEKAREEAARKAALAAQNANKSTGQSSASTGVTKTNPNTDSNAGSTQNTVNSATGYIWPLPGYSTVSSDFGYRSDPFTGKQSYHSGIDIPAPAGTRIVAAASGQVAWANYSTTAGNWIGIDHGNGVYTVYMHCSALIVSAGQNVSAGDVIGLVGTTGSSTGNHLHFSVRLNGAYVSPWNYVSK